MQISQKSIQYVLLLLILAIGICAYEFGYVKYIEKAASVKDECKQIEAQIAELNEKEASRAQWEEGIAESEQKISEILAKYGAGNTPEKSIMFVRGLEKATSATIPNVSFNTDNVIFVSPDVDENGNPKVEMDSTYIAISYNTTYNGLKRIMDYINTYKERMNVNSFSANYNQENGQLAGNMIINLYSVKDADHEYTDPAVPGVKLGTDNIFGTIDWNKVTEGE